MGQDRRSSRVVVDRVAQHTAASALLLLSLACGSTPASHSPVPVPTPAPRLLVISVDGLRPDAIYAAETPNIRGLVARSSYTWRAQTIMPSNTLPSHVSMLTGVTPAVHGITWDEYLPKRGQLTTPTLFNAAAAAGKRSAIVAGKDKFLTLKDGGGVDVCVLTARGDNDVANETIVRIDAGFDLVFVHMPDMDLTGHAKRWLSPEYLQSLRVVDAAVGRILTVVPPHMSVILTADHGGSGAGHGTSAPAHVTIPWMIQGPRIRPGYALDVLVNTTDTAVTAAHILGLKVADSVSGRIVSEAFVDAYR